MQCTISERINIAFPDTQFKNTLINQCPCTGSYETVLSSLSSQFSLRINLLFSQHSTLCLVCAYVGQRGTICRTNSI